MPSFLATDCRLRSLVQIAEQRNTVLQMIHPDGRVNQDHGRAFEHVLNIYFDRVPPGGPSRDGGIVAAVRNETNGRDASRLSPSSARPSDFKKRS